MSKSKIRSAISVGKLVIFSSIVIKRNMNKKRLVDEGNVVEPQEINTIDVYFVTKLISKLGSINIA